MLGEGRPSQGGARRVPTGPRRGGLGLDGRPGTFPPTPAPWQGLPGPASLECTLLEQLAGWVPGITLPCPPSYTHPGTPPRYTTPVHPPTRAAVGPRGHAHMTVSGVA